MPKPKPNQIVDPTVVNAACVPASEGLLDKWHRPGIDVLILLEGGEGKIGIGRREVTFVGDTLVFLRGDTKRGYWDVYLRPAKAWHVFFRSSPLFYESLPHLKQTDSLKMMWQLSGDQEAAFKAYFIKIVAEHAIQRPSMQMAQSSWLRLLLVGIERWVTSRGYSVAPPEAAESDVLKLWEKINGSLDEPEFLKNQLYQLFPNYNSLRHRFRKTFGASPKQMMTALKINQAKVLLLESSLGLKEIASRLGYYRHHEFTRAFRKFVGMSPSQWRLNPAPNAIKADTHKMP